MENFGLATNCRRAAIPFLTVYSSLPPAAFSTTWSLRPLTRPILHRRPAVGPGTVRQRGHYERSAYGAAGWRYVMRLQGLRTTNQPMSTDGSA